MCKQMSSNNSFKVKLPTNYSLTNPIYIYIYIYITIYEQTNEL